MDGGSDHHLDHDLDEVWKALSDPTRRAIMDLLRDGRKTTGELVSAFPGMTRFGVMKHIRVLEDAHRLVHRREGRTRWNYLNAVPLRRIYERWVSKYEDQWAGALTNLKHIAETEKSKENES